MRSLRIVVVLCLLSTAVHAGVRPLVFAGVGLPELLHAEAGVLINGRVSVEARFGWVVFNSLAGVGVTGWFLGEATDRPPQHSLLGSVDFRINPTLQPLRLTSGGETLGAALGTSIGYAWTTDLGFSLRALVGLLFSVEQHVAVGPNFTLGIGWVF